jgi:uncharacterized protein (DUF58 family)
MLGFMAVSGVFGLRNLQKLALSVKFPDEIYCGIPTQLTLQLTSLKHRLPHYLLTLRVIGAAVDFQILAAGVRQEKKVLVTFHKRGRGTITKASVSSPFPVNFFVRSNLFDLEAPYLVFPQPVPLPQGVHHEEFGETGSTVQRRKGNSGETESIGAYTEAEPLKQIHWKLTARHDELLVKEMATESGKPVVIDLDVLHGGVEERLCHAAHLINRLMAEGRAVGLQLGGKSIPPGTSRNHRLKMLGELADHAAN